MKKTKITVTEFGKIVEEIPASKFDYGITHIYLNNLSNENLSYLKKYASTFSDEKILSCMVHWNDNIETFCNFGEKYLVY